MSALYDRMVAADDAREFAHDHAAEIIREMLMVEKTVKRWEDADMGAFAVMHGNGGVEALKLCIQQIREAMA